MFTKKKISLLIVSFAVTVCSINSAVADDAVVTPDTPVIAPQCWFICPPDQKADDE